MDNVIYLFSAFAVSWTILFIYVFAIFKRQRKLEPLLERMEKLVGPED
ncbi:MAG: CcmD family protein [Deltaproteobacteria bacterium]|nr:CcmD family protein [Deltaproteobacteria bacterium]